MSKNKQLYDLRLGITVKSQQIYFILNNIYEKAECGAEAHTLMDLVLDEIKKISKMSEKIGRILKH